MNEAVLHLQFVLSCTKNVFFTQEEQPKNIESPVTLPLSAIPVFCMVSLYIMSHPGNS
jgi:hypothetical protein